MINVDFGGFITAIALGLACFAVLEVRSLRRRLETLPRSSTYRPMAHGLRLRGLAMLLGPRAQLITALRALMA